MQFSKSPPLFLPCTPADNDGNHPYEKDFRKFSLSSYLVGGGGEMVVAAWRVLRGKEAGPETAVSADDRLRTQRRSCMLLQRCTPIGVHTLPKRDFVYCTDVWCSFMAEFRNTYHNLHADYFVIRSCGIKTSYASLQLAQFARKLWVIIGRYRRTLNSSNKLHRTQDQRK